MHHHFRALEVFHSAGKCIESHSHSFGQLTIITQGTMAITSENGWWLIPPGMSLWVPPGEKHSSSYSEDSKVILLEFYNAEISELPKDCHPVVVSDLFRALASESVDISIRLDNKTNDEYDDGYLKSLIGILTIHIARAKDKPSLFVPFGTDKRLRKATEFIKNNISADSSLSVVASKSNTSERTLTRLFVTETGMSFSRWKQHLRLVKAIDLLLHGESISSVALELGYSSSSSFTTLFTRVLGVPPRKYLQRIIGYHAHKI